MLYTLIATSKDEELRYSVVFHPGKYNLLQKNYIIPGKKCQRNLLNLIPAGRKPERGESINFNARKRKGDKNEDLQATTRIKDKKSC